MSNLASIVCFLIGMISYFVDGPEHGTFWVACAIFLLLVSKFTKNV